MKSCLITSNDLVEDQWYDKDFDKCQDDLANEYRNLGGTPNPKLIEDIEQCCKAWVYGEEKTEMSEQSRRFFEYFKESGVLRRALCECYMRYHHGHVEDVCFKGNPAALIEICTQNHS
ncbi:hypothetical protein L596_020064 [Steinernema carpocapsae]|uniref:Uncharacterized protein n=1 Tax=Steinernema carpocapsae TaxID=34508 RepID=A0A4U5MSF5_STECR|nr:hypothetical protein L596_020064 [Steinernema carpocapsae]